LYLWLNLWVCWWITPLVILNRTSQFINCLLSNFRWNEWTIANSMCMRMTQFTCKSICFCWYGFWIVQLSSFRSMLCILIALSCWSWFACTISRTINHQHCCWYTICTLIFVLQVSSLCSWFRFPELDFGHDSWTTLTRHSWLDFAIWPQQHLLY